MKHSLARIMLASGIALGLAAPPAHATTGYFLNGYGGKARGMGGAGVAFAQDSMAPATNPTGMLIAIPIPIKATPTVPAVDQELPVERDTMAQMMQVVTRNTAGEMSCNP